MKTLIPFGFLLTLVLCIDASHRLKGSHQRHLVSKLTSRTLQGACDVDCSSLGIHSTDDWTITLQNLGLAIIYSKAQNALAIVNFNLKMATVLVNGLLGIFDIEKGLGLIVNLSNGVANFVTNLTTLSSLFLGTGANLINGAISIAKTVKSSAAIVASLTAAGAFSVATVIFSSLSLGAQVIVNGLAVKAKLTVDILSNFKIFFGNLVKVSLAGGLNIGLGAANLVAGIFGGGVAVLASGFISLAIFIAGSVNLSSNIIFGLVHNLLFFADAIVAGSLSAVNLVNNSWQFYAGLLPKLLFTVTLDGLIVVNNAVVATLETFGSLGLGIAFGGQMSIAGSASIQ